MPTESKSDVRPFIHALLVISMLLNLSGMASIVDGFVVWAVFFRDFIEIYRAWIREPILWAAHLVWPASWPPVPGWVADWLCINGSFVLATNIMWVRLRGRTMFADLMAEAGSVATRLEVIVLVLLSSVAIGLLFLPVCFTAVVDRENNLSLLVLLYFYWFTLLGTFVSLMLLNEQVPRGVW